MRRLLMLLFVIIASAQLLAQTAEKTVPFTVVLTKVTIPDAPKLQGFAFGRAGGKWLLVAGRHAGLHTFNRPTKANPVNNFPPQEFNDRLFVIDPVAKRVWSAPLTGLPAKTAARLTVTNAEFEQSGDWLYIAGGYGFDPATKTMDTFGSLTAIKLSATIDAIVNGKPFAANVQQIDDLRMQVTGGEMKKLGDWFVLVFGQKFQGLYTPNDSQIGLQFKQLYSEQIALFKIGMAGGKLAISDYQQPITAPPVNSTDVSVTRPFHRRDFSLAQFVDVNGKTGLAAYGGVFLPGQIGAYRNPVYITASTAVPPAPQANVAVDSYAQFMNLYNCPVIPAWSAKSRTMYTTFFGGISGFYIDRTGRLERDSGLPFVDSITTLVRDGNGGSSECFFPIKMPGLLGADMAYIAATDGIVQLDAMKSQTLVGYLYGGILAQAPNKGTTDASSNVYAVSFKSATTTCPVSLPRPEGTE